MVIIDLHSINQSINQQLLTYSGVSKTITMTMVVKKEKMCIFFVYFRRSIHVGISTKSTYDFEARNLDSGNSNFYIPFVPISVLLCTN